MKCGVKSCRAEATHVIYVKRAVTGSPMEPREEIVCAPCRDRVCALLNTYRGTMTFFVLPLGFTEDASRVERRATS